MDPVTMSALVGGGSAVAGAAANYVNAEKSRKARKGELERLDAIANALQDPNFDTRLLTPEDYELAGKYSPEMADYIAEVAPTLVKAASEGAVKGREAQMSALQKFRQLSETGEDVQSQILREQALKSAAIQNRGQQEAIKQSFAQRGAGGSSMELVSALLAQQGGAQNAQQASQQAALDAYNNRLAAMRSSADLGGQIRGEDVAMESRNASAIDDYNQRMAARRQDYLQGIAGTRNDAQLKNIGAQQAVMNANVAQRNNARTRDQDVYNDAQRAKFNSALAKANLKSGNVGQNLESIKQTEAANASAINALAGAGIKAGETYAESEENRKNRAAKYGYTG